MIERGAAIAPALALALAACGHVGGNPSSQAPAASPLAGLDTVALAGDYRWMLRTEEAGTSRVETEAWRLARDPADPTQLVGRYLRTVEVRSLDRAPFRCNQRPWYRQRALFDVRVKAQGAGYAVVETGYRVEPSPCDDGFRKLGSYAATFAGARLGLRWDGGSQALWRVPSPTSARASELPAAPWPAAYDLAGPWRWDATSYDAQGNLRDESEWWELTRRDETHVDATYRRRVTTRSPDGSPIPCAGAPRWSFDDVYVLEGQLEESHWHLHEIAVEPGDHPCLAATPRRVLDEATGEQIGDFLVLEWRGKRRQVLYRDDDAARDDAPPAARDDAPPAARDDAPPAAAATRGE